MPTPAEWASTSHEFGLVLQRKFWKPLRNMMDIFHVLPLAAVVIIFVLLATDGQFRELYISYLEGPRAAHANAAPTHADWAIWIVSMVTGLAAIALISAVLFEAHYALSTMRLNIIYSSYSNPDSNSRLRNLQKAAAFILAFLPWFGLAIGLLNARDFVAARYCQLLNNAGVPSDELYTMEHLWMPGGWTIAAGLIVLGAAAAGFSSIGEQHRGAQRAVAFCAPALAVLLFMLFTDLLEFNLGRARLVGLGLLVAVITLIYFMIYQWLYRRRGGFIHSGRGISLRKRRRRWFAAWAFLPWFALAAYFARVQYAVPAVRPGSPWPTCPISISNIPAPGYWAAFPVAMCYTIAIGLLVGHLLGRFAAHEYRCRAVMLAVAALAVLAIAVSFADVNAAVSIYRFIGPLGTVALQLLFLISTMVLLAWLSQRSGFPMLTLVILALVVALTFPSHIEATEWAIGFVCAGVAVMAAISRRFGIAIMVLLLPVLLGINAYKFSDVKPVDQNRSPVADSDRVKYKFSCWLNERGVPVANPAPAVLQDPNCVSDVSPANARKPWQAGVKYPVFIVAAEGGGIYAASAASIFLARSRDLAPQFDDHVFAVSGVSGGSIGAAIFQALDRATHQDSPAKSDGSAARSPVAHDVSKGDSADKQQPACPQYQPPSPDIANQSLEEKAANVMEDDHFSPVIGSVFTEIFSLPLNRPDALVASFENSTAAQDDKAGRDLCAPFAGHWQPAAFAPALALNSTWVEMGFRVAFAPFALNDLDESLYSFGDLSMPDEKAQSLMQAAGVSARFPLIMPPFSAVMQNPDKTDPMTMDTKRWNFVDGAYSDNSGATTALDIYKAIENVSPQNVDLRLILITSSIPQPDLASSDINGTVFRDTVAPLDALMKVREDLGNDAVARACTYVYHDDLKPEDTSTDAASGKSAEPGPAGKHGRETNQDCIEHAGGLKSRLSLVEIQDQTYGLSLGWKISKTSFDVVSWMLGKPDSCLGQYKHSAQVSEPHQQDVPASADNLNTQLSNNILERNSCVLKTIIGLVNGSLSSPVTASPQNATQ
jgi:hypothetical protein